MNSTTVEDIASRKLHRFLPLRVVANTSELNGLLSAFLCALTMFASYSILRPIRETMGVTSGVASLPWMFWATFASMLVIQPIFGWLTSRFSLALLLPKIYLFFAITLVGFYGWFHVQQDHTWIARVYFVWVSVFNLFIVSVFWSLMADIFTKEQAGRFFGFIAGGISIGGLLGSMLAGWLAKPIGTINLLLVSAGLLAAAALIIGKIIQWHKMHGELETKQHMGSNNLGGSAWAAFSQVSRSPYLIGVALFVLLLSSATTVIYVEQNRAVGAAISSPDERTALFGQIDFWVQMVAMAGQIFVFGPLMKRLGFSVMLSATPLLMILAFGVLWLVPSLNTAIAAICLRRVGEYAFTRPSRDMLFTVLSREEKYKAKNLLDTFVYRGGDALSASIYQGVAGHSSGSAAGVAGVMVSTAWLSVSVWLARKFKRMSDTHA